MYECSNGVCGPSVTHAGLHPSEVKSICDICRDADETKDWIDEKDQALNIEDFGHDLTTVQRLQRKHEGLERDLAALGEKVKDLDETTERLMQTHPDQVWGLVCYGHALASIRT